MKNVKLNHKINYRTVGQWAVTDPDSIQVAEEVEAGVLTHFVAKTPCLVNGDVRLVTICNITTQSSWCQGGRICTGCHVWQDSNTTRALLSARFLADKQDHHHLPWIGSCDIFWCFICGTEVMLPYQCSVEIFSCFNCSFLNYHWNHENTNRTYYSMTRILHITMDSIRLDVLNCHCKTPIEPKKIPLSSRTF